MQQLCLKSFWVSPMGGDAAQRGGAMVPAALLACALPHKSTLLASAPPERMRALRSHAPHLRRTGPLADVAASDGGLSIPSLLLGAAAAAAAG
jgi:hypothetical protein